jgi:hypothetical protein
VKTLTTLFIVLIGLGFHFCVSPNLEEAQKRAKLVEQWNLINEANEDGSGVYYSTSGLFDQTLTIYLSKSSDPVDQDQFLSEVEQSDEDSGEMRALGFESIKCGDHTMKLREGTKRPPSERRELDIENVG